MDEKALSPARRRGRPLLWALLLLPLLHFGVTAAIRSYVSAEMAGVVGRSLPSFSLRDRSGQVWSNERLKGRRVLLNFFRSYCPNCLQEAPALRTLHKELDPERVLLLSVMMDEVQGYDPELTARTLERVAFSHPVLMADADFVDAFHGTGWAHVTPVTYVVDDKGKIVQYLRGHQSLEVLRGATQ